MHCNNAFFLNKLREPDIELSSQLKSSATLSLTHTLLSCQWANK